MTETLIEVNNLTVSYKNRTLYKNMTFSVNEGEFLAVLGPNGAGKTTLIKHLLGVITSQSGSISILGSNPKKVRQKIGYVPQLSSQEFGLPINVKEFIRLGLDGNKYGLPWHKNWRSKVDSVLTLLDIAHLKNAKVSTLSGGEFQRVRIAQAIVKQPKVLFFDEALLSLDITHQSLVGELLSQYQKSVQSCIVFVAHELNSIIPYVTKILYIANGNWAIGSANEILKSETLTNLYGSEIEVANINGKTVILGSGESYPDIHHKHALTGSDD
jgi:zinc/manganese transport system ATP-binding protein